MFVEVFTPILAGLLFMTLVVGIGLATWGDEQAIAEQIKEISQ